MNPSLSREALSVPFVEAACPDADWNRPAHGIVRSIHLAATVECDVCDATGEDPHGLTVEGELHPISAACSSCHGTGRRENVDRCALCGAKETGGDAANPPMLGACDGCGLHVCPACIEDSDYDPDTGGYVRCARCCSTEPDHAA